MKKHPRENRGEKRGKKARVPAAQRAARAYRSKNPGSPKRMLAGSTPQKGPSARGQECRLYRNYWSPGVHFYKCHNSLYSGVFPIPKKTGFLEFSEPNPKKRDFSLKKGHGPQKRHFSGFLGLSIN